MGKPHYIGSANCSRCHGGDPNCPVCHDIAEEPTLTEEEANEKFLAGDDYEYRGKAFEQAVERGDYLHDQLRDREFGE